MNAKNKAKEVAIMLQFGAFTPNSVWSKCSNHLHDGLAGYNRDDIYRVALLVPMCGTAGLWGPSCIASAELAVRELNNLSGISGRAIQVKVVDSAEEAEIPAEAVVRSLIEHDSVDAIVGMHISAVRRRLTKVIGGRIPYVYTPLYEGGERSDGVFTIGDTPKKQLGPAIDYLHNFFHIKKWALIGNDYICPRGSHEYAKSKIADLGGELVHEKFVPFNFEGLEEEVDQISKSGADGVLISLVGQDAVNFNRIFGAANLHKRTVRVSCLMEENGLLASGADNLERFFSCSSYFAALNTPENTLFQEKYHTLHKIRAPMLNAIGQSTYEGFQFLASLIGNSRTDCGTSLKRPLRPIEYKSVRKSVYISNSANTAPVYLARVNGVIYDEIRRIA